MFDLNLNNPFIFEPVETYPPEDSAEPPKTCQKNDRPAQPPVNNLDPAETIVPWVSAMLADGKIPEEYYTGSPQKEDI